MEGGGSHILITIFCSGYYFFVIVLFTSTCFNILIPVQSHRQANFRLSKLFCSSFNSDLEFLTAPSPAYKEVKWFHKFVDFEVNKQCLKAELRLQGCFVW